VGDTAMPGGLHARLCHAFLVLIGTAFRSIVVSFLASVSVVASSCRSMSTCAYI